MTPVSESVQAKMACLRQISFALEDKALDAANALTKKSGVPREIVECNVCRGFHIVTKRAS